MERCYALQDFHTKYLAATVAVALIIGPFFTGHLRPDDSMQGRASMLSNMRYHTSVIIALFSALGSLASSSRKLMKLGAYAERIVSLQDVARHVCQGRPSFLHACREAQRAGGPFAMHIIAFPMHDIERPLLISLWILMHVGSASLPQQALCHYTQHAVPC